MNAIQVNTIGPSATFRYTPVNNPQRVDNEVLIKLEAIGVNPLEQTIRLGYFPTSMLPPFIPGSEGAGTVVEAAGGFLPGDRVFILGGGHGISNQGTYAEYISVNKNGSSGSRVGKFHAQKCLKV